MNRNKISIAVSLVLMASGAAAAHADAIADWNFGGPGVPASGSTDLTPAATGGTAAASSTAQDVGMTNSYTEANGATSSVSADNITQDLASTIGNQDVWRVVGGAGSAPGSTGANGWSTAAAQYSQGAQFTTSTVGYTNEVLSFSWASTKQGIQDMQVQYNLNVNNASGWTNVGASSLSGDTNAQGSLLVASIGNGTGGVYTTDTVNLGTLADNDANFGIRLVAAYNPNLAGGTQYAAASSTFTAPTEYNNSSGNWRFADVQIDGTPVPLPPGLALLVSGLGGLGLLARRRKTV